MDFLNKTEIHYIIKEKNHIRKRIYRNLNSYQFLKIEESINILDFEGLNKFITETEESEILNDYKAHMQKAYAWYYIEEHYEAYKEYKKISEKALKDKEFVIYALSEFNRYYSGLLAKRRIYGKNKLLYNRIDKEIKKIDLNRILLKEPFQIKELEFLRAIYNWNFDNSKIDKLSNIKHKVDKDAETCYIGIDRDSTGIYQLQTYITKYMKFIKYNLLVVDKFMEVREVFYNYIDIILKSYVTPKICHDESESFFGVPSQNITIEKIDLFNLLVMIQYINNKDLEALFNKHAIEKLKVSEEDINLFITSIKNCITFIKNKNRYHTRVDINTIFTILSKIRLSKEQYDIINNLILGYMEMKQLDINNYKSINKFIYYQYMKYNNFELQSMESILGNTIETLKNANFIDTSQIAIINNITYFIKEKDKKHKYRCKGILGELEDSTNDKKYEILINLHSVLYSDDKRKVSTIIKNKLSEKEKFTKLHSDIYCEALMNDVIKPNLKFEGKLILFLEDLQQEKQEEKILKYWPDTLNETLEKIPNLILNGYIKDTKKFEKFLGINDKYDFLIKTKEFPVEKIKLNWLYDYNDNLLRRISEYENVKKYIKKEIEKLIIQDENIDNKLLKIYVKYFA